LGGGPPPNPTPSDNHDNTAGGSLVLIDNVDSSSDTAFGAGALRSATRGSNNTAIGWRALFSNTEGGFNTASGGMALIGNTTGQYNTAVGWEALGGNVSNNNTAVGFQALANNTTGNNNTAVGAYAWGFGGDYSNATAIGYGASVTASNSIVLGNASITTIYAQVSTITGVSDRRRKKDITTLGSDLGIDFIKKLQPVSYRFNNGDETERYGFIAQDLVQALPASLHETIERSEPKHGLALIERQNDEDRTYRISYGELLAPIVKSIQEQQREITSARQENADLRHAVQALQYQAAAFKAENDALRHSLEVVSEQVRAAYRPIGGQSSN